MTGYFLLDEALVASNSGTADGAGRLWRGGGLKGWIEALASHWTVWTFGQELVASLVAIDNRQ